MGNSHGKPVVFTDEVNLNHFRLLRVVGKGAFGKVRIVERKDTGLTFALKYIRKDEVVRSESVRNIIRERRMLQNLNHPFLCNLRYSFQDIEYLYIVVDLMNGGDLRFHISRKTFTEEAVRFWIAELSCALRYIHSQGIVHRDVKPDNILLDSDGHVHLADFNVASDLHPNRPLTSKSGTLAYLAPEVYAGKGYGSEVDWWSLGVVFYECIYLKRPFDGHSHESLKRDILRANPVYPQTKPAVSSACVDAISSLVDKNTKRRIGASSFESLTQHEFFKPIDFEALERKEIEPIFRPSREKVNFDATYDLEELLLEEAPLEARAKRQKPRSELKADASAKEIREDELHRMIETLFEPFDYTTVSFDKRASQESNPRTSNTLLPEPVFPGKKAESNNSTPANSRPQSRSQGANPTPSTLPRDAWEMPTQTDRPSNQRSRSAHAFAGEPPFSSSISGGLDTGSPTEKSQGAVNAWPEYDKFDASRPALPRGENGNGMGHTATVAAVGASGKDRPSGMMGFLSRRKGRERSPKPTERGVLGRGNVRQVVGHR